MLRYDKTFEVGTGMAVSGSPEPGQSLAGHGEVTVAQTEKGAGQGHTVSVTTEAGVEPKESSRSAASPPYHRPGRGAEAMAPLQTWFGSSS